MRYVKLNIVLVVVAALLLSCGRNTKSKKSEVTPQRKEFRLPEVPPSLRGEAARAYLRDNMWQGFDFADTLRLVTLDKDVIMRAFMLYVGAIRNEEASQELTRFMQRASTSKPMFDYFLSLAEQILHNPNSPMRDDEKYIPILEVALASGWLDDYERLPYEHDLKVARLNRVGHKAADFAYTTADGRTRRLWSLKSDYILIFISNPDCPMCRDIREQIKASPILSEMIAGGALKIIVIYPDEDLALWREHLGDYPKEWVNAYDKGQEITHKELYDLRAIPSLYLLDRDKLVMAKDCTDVGYIEKLISTSAEL